MGSESIIDEQELQNLVQEVVSDQLGDDDELDHEFNNQAPDQNDAELRAEIESQDDYDVFDHKINPRIKAGDYVKIEVHKDGVMEGTERGIWSWDKIHQKYGGGHIKIKARGSNGRHVGQETRLLGELKPVVTNEAETLSHAPQNQGLDSKDFFLMMTKMGEQADEKAQRRIDSEQAQNSSMMQLLVTALSKPAPTNDNSSMLLEMQKMNMQMFEKMNEKSSESAKELRQEMRELVKEIGSSKKEDGMSSIEMFKMMRDSEETGRQSAQVMFDLVEQKAELIALRNGNSDKDESLVDKVIGNLGSLLPMFAQMKGPMATPATNTQPRRQLRPNKANPQRRVNPNGARVEPNQVQRPQGSNSEQNRNITRKSPLGMPTIEEPVETAPVLTPNIVDKPETVEVVTELAQNPDLTTIEDSQVEQIREQIMEVSIPIIASSLMKGVTAEVASLECLSALSQHPFFTLEVEDKLDELFTLQMINLLAEKSGLIAQAESLGKKAEVTNWLEEFHVDLISKTREESEHGESPLD